MAPIIVNALFFGCISAASFWHFGAKQNTYGNSIIRVASLLSSIVLIYFAIDQMPTPFLIKLLSILITVSAFLMFFLSVKETRGKKFGVAFDASMPNELVSSGIYSKIRNPFYVSYLLYWTSWVVYFQLSLLSIIVLAFFAVVYTKSVLLEERVLKETFGKDFSNYCAGTGRFLPKI